MSIKKNELKAYTTPDMLEKQEHLSLAQLAKLEADSSLFDVSDRPMKHFIEIMGWAENTFKSALKDQDLLNRYVHNRIIIDGQFMLFCEQNGISVECLYKDSVISWKSNNDYEKYFAQGVFLIKTKDCEFLQNSLWLQGQQGEDEINFFVIVSNKNYEAYLKMRNEFDAWVQARDRSNLHIRVIEGEDLPYTKDQSWEDLFLPEPLKKEVRELVENFLNSKDFYLEKKIPWKRGVLLYGAPER